MRTLRSIRSGAAWRAGAPAVDAGQERPPGDPGSTDASLEHPANVCRAHRDSCSLPLLPSRVPVGSSANPKGLPASGGCQTSPPEGRLPTYLRWNGLQATVPPELVTLKNSVPADWPTGSRWTQVRRTEPSSAAESRLDPPVPSPDPRCHHVKAQLRGGLEDVTPGLGRFDSRAAPSSRSPGRSPPTPRTNAVLVAVRGRPAQRTTPRQSPRSRFHGKGSGELVDRLRRPLQMDVLVGELTLLAVRSQEPSPSLRARSDRHRCCPGIPASE
jgi:hypothetical protein